MLGGVYKSVSLVFFLDGSLFGRVRQLVQNARGQKGEKERG